MPTIVLLVWGVEILLSTEACSGVNRWMTGKVANRENDICYLDYLVGTIATAYKGPIASLVTKNFCMSDDGLAATLTGTVLSMPDGNYEASLTQSGIELSRVGLKKGFFEFRTDSDRVAGGRDLQIDIVQAGRHIGTFLLRKKQEGGVYISAVELSAELAGFDLTLLTKPVSDRVGLLQEAEAVVAQLHSTKKDWAAFSEKLNGYSVDFFWAVPEAYYRAFDVLTHFSLLAAARCGAASSGKPLSNYFNLLELPLVNERDPSRLRSPAQVWTTALASSSLDLSVLTTRTVALLRDLNTNVPDVDLRGVLLRLITSIREKIESAPFLNAQALESLGGVIPQDDAGLLARFGEAGRRHMLETLAHAEQWTEKGEPGRALAKIAGSDTDILDDRKAVSLFFDVMEKNLSSESSDAFVKGIDALLSIADRLSDASRDSLRLYVPKALDRLVAIDRAGLSDILLRSIAAIGSPLKEQMMLDPRLARSVLQSGRSTLTVHYREQLKQIIIPPARVRGISSDTWAEIVNPLHLERLSRFMDLLMTGDEQFEDILVHVIANLTVGGVLIPDDRLFQRRISAYLNSPAMHEQFLFQYLLLERLPVYFNEVGATSRIRDYSTEIDSWGNDPILYFLRKQVHVNASSHNIELIESVMRSWLVNDPTMLRDKIPPDVLAQAKPDLLERYASVIDQFFVTTGVQDDDGLHLDRLLALADETIDREIERSGDGDGEAREKTRLLCKLYKEIVRKYSLLTRDSAIGNVHTRLAVTISDLHAFKGIVLSPEKTEAQESLYFKRHIAFGIPSVLGTYHERKFDALSGMMRAGEDIPVLLETIIAEIRQEGTSAAQADFHQWMTSLEAAWEVLKVFGMQNVLIDEFVSVLDHNRLHRVQIIDVLKMWQKELAWAVSVLSRTFHWPLREIIGRFSRQDIQEPLTRRGTSSQDFIGMAADVAFRDILGSIPGLVESDRLLDALVDVLRTPTAGGLKLEREAADPVKERDFYDMHAVSAEDAGKHAPELGGKAKNLFYLREKGFRIPAGVVLPARHTRDHERFTDQAEFPALLKKAVRAIELRTDTVFGASERPLFLSVRSGAYPSMPGILSSILYCGMNEQTVDAFIGATGDPSLGWDSYRRFIEHYGTAVYGLENEFFATIMKQYRRSHSLKETEPLGPQHLQTIVGRYRARLDAMQMSIPGDVYEQLRQCVSAVYASWESERARQFRSATGTAEEWGTSVTLMEMVFGNGKGGGVSMFFTRDPRTFERVVYGETREGVTGDDLASGRMSGQPLSRAQQKTGEKSLEESDPRLFRMHEDLAREIEDAFGALPQEVEVTYMRDANGRPLLWVLQTRRMEQGRGGIRKFDEICRLENRVIGRGIGTQGGAVSGVASFATSRAAIEMLRKKTGLPVILIRKTANTDDVSLMPVIGGIVTASGGVTSHAAVLAREFGLAAVVGCPDLRMETDDHGQPFAMISATPVGEETAISIDGSTGLVFSGSCFETTGKNEFH